MAFANLTNSEPPHTAQDQATNAIAPTCAGAGAGDKTMAKMQYQVSWPFHGNSMTTTHRTIKGAARASLKRHGECVCSPKFARVDGRATDLEIELYQDERIRLQAVS